jgi:hypothetical protein
MFTSHARKSFWDCYDALPIDIRREADKQFALFENDPWHPSLRLKEIRGLWSVRISISHRAVARRRDDTFYWFWIGDHPGYERLISR